MIMCVRIGGQFQFFGVLIGRTFSKPRLGSEKLLVDIVQRIKQKLSVSRLQNIIDSVFIATF